ncbi:MAG: porin family protein, partial [Treponema sp.]|nr:porin family protein [Treponema sp.]
MKKRIFLSAVLAAAVAGGAFAQAWYNSYAPGIDGSKLLANVGIGFGVLPYKTSLPAISASAEYALAKLPLSVGAYFGITTYDEELYGYISYKGTLTGFGAKGSYHFNFLKNLDPYVSLTLGWLIWSEELVTSTATRKNDRSTFFYGFSLGARYFFTNNIGAYAELGYSAVSV